MSAAEYEKPLIIDLDGTLSNGDISYELCIRHLKETKFTGFVELLRGVYKGKAFLKNFLSNKYLKDFDPEFLPYNKDIFEESDFKNRKMILISGSPNAFVAKVAEHLKIFNSYKGSSEEINLIGKNKLNYIQTNFGKDFDYIGNSKDDIPVWEEADKAYGININKDTANEAIKKGINLKIISRKKSFFKTLIQSMRIHQWFKNILVFAIPFLNINYFNSDWVYLLLLTFFSFGLVASATYLLNDLLDIESDRRHKSKKFRPIPSGDLSIPFAVTMILILFSLGLLLSSIVGNNLILILGAYALLSITYSFFLKRIAILDVMTLSFLFCWRVFTGGVVASLEVNVWFMLSLGFIFLSLALGKRFIELKKTNTSQSAQSKFSLPGRGYSSDDIIFIMSSGIASGFAALVIILIYLMLTLSVVVSNNISIISIIFLIVWWFLRFWFLMIRDLVNDDPIVFALKDNISRFTLFLIIVILLAEQIF